MPIGRRVPGTVLPRCVTMFTFKPPFALKRTATRSTESWNERSCRRMSVNLRCHTSSIGDYMRFGGRAEVALAALSSALRAFTL